MNNGDEMDLEGSVRKILWTVTWYIVGLVLMALLIAFTAWQIWGPSCVL